MKRHLRPFLATLTAALVGAGLPSANAADTLELKKGDSIAILGSGVADRAQHYGWLEAMLQQAYPEAQLSFRNLAFSGDEVNTWHRVGDTPEDFGTRDQWLTKVKADVIFAFYGYNESFKGYEGLDEFKKNVDTFLKDLAKQNYSGKGAPRIVLFSPIALEKLPNPSLPPVEDKNTNIQNYAAAMAEVAATNGVVYVDLFRPSQRAYQTAAEPLTLNGLYQNSAGDKAIASAAFKGLTGKTPPEVSDKLLAAVHDKDWEWHLRYRTVDGYNVYGGRSGLAYATGIAGFKQKERQPEAPYISNFQVMQQEMAQRDQKTANREARVWAIAKGGDLEVKDDNLPAVQKVGSNMPDPKSGVEFNKVPMTGMTFTEEGLIAIPDAKSKLKDIITEPKLKLTLFADEKRFPELVNPVAMQWDTKGRLWISAWRNYPERTPTSKKGDSLLVFEDTDGDGVADKMTEFVDDLNCPTGFQIYKDGVIVMQSPSLVYISDTDGDGKGDKRERILTGLCAADSHHETCYLTYDNGGAIYPSDGVFHRTQVETLYGPVRNTNGCIYRYDLNRQKLERFTTDACVNPHGKIWDRWGNAYFTDATGNVNTFAEASSCYLPLEGGSSAKLKEFWVRPARPSPGNMLISSRHFPDDWQNNFLNCNVISYQGIWRVPLTQDGAGMKGDTQYELVKVDPAVYPTFRPSCVSVGLDGALYFCDWANATIGHMQHHLRDPNRDHQHGRIYKLTYEGRELLKPKKIAGESIPNLLELLKEWEDITRQLAKVELAKHDHREVAEAAAKWAANLDKSDPEYEHHRLEALWVHQWVDVVNADLLKQVLASPDPRARAAATRVLCYWRENVPDALGLLKKRVNDEDMRVRMQAVRALSFFQPTPDARKALEIAFEVLKQPTDYYIEHVFGECRKGLQSGVKDGKVLPADAGVLATFLKQTSDADLKDLPDVEAVLVAKLTRKGVTPDVKAAALDALAKKKGTNQATQLIALLKKLDGEEGGGGSVATDLGKMLVLQPKADLAAAREKLFGFAFKSKNGPQRIAGAAATVVADGSPEKTWGAVSKNQADLIALIGGIPLIPPTELALRSQFQPLLAGLLQGKPEGGLLRAVIEALPLTGMENAAVNFTTVAKLLESGTERAVAAKALIKFPRANWAADQAKPVVDSVLAYAKTVPAGDRSKQEYVEIITAAKELTSLLPEAEGKALRKELRGVSVDVFIVHTVHEQLRYDTSKITVQAGKPFEVVFENDDGMPHNFVIVPPGKHLEIGTAAMTMMPTQLDKQGRAFIPASWEKEVLAATKLLEPGQKETLKLRAPGTPGEYEFVCTFPGHSVIMWGTLVVTKDAVE